MQTLDVKEGDELKLICDPFFNPALKSTTLFYRWAYDVFDIGVFREGEVRLRAAFAPHSDNPGDQTLVLKVMWRPVQDEPDAGAGWVAGEISLPLRFDRSSSCILVNLDKVTGEPPREALADGTQATCATRSDTAGAAADGAQATRMMLGDTAAPAAVIPPGAPAVVVLD